MRLFIFVVLFLYFTLNIICANDVKTVTVRIKNGLINGRVETPIDGKQLNVYKGIPFAEPPVGDLRFRKPLPIGRLKDPVNAFHFQSACPLYLKRYNVEDHLLNKNVSEDCLYLNVWSPVDSHNNDVLKPVMFWIHGGGLLMGSPSEEYYQGDILAAKGDVVVVSASYRTNIFGFLFTGTEDAPGNAGLWDQALALEWVKDNIKYFGGDPNQVTIFGESAGGWSVSLHIISPISRHLFKNAILNSGAFVYRFTEDRPEDHIQRWLKGLKLVGCSDEDNPAIFTPKLINFIKTIDYSKLVPITEEFWDIIPGSIKTMNMAVIDGQFLPYHPNEMLKNGDFKQDVNIMISTVEDEGSFLISNFNDTEKFDPLNPKNMIFSEAYNHLREMSSNMNSELAINGEDVAKLYYTGLSDSSGYDLLRKTIGIATGDYYLTCPTLLFAKEVFRNTNFKSNVYQYYYNSKFQTDHFCSYWMGVCHANDVYPMFGMPFLKPDQYNDRERQISEQMIKFITDFVKTGKPTLQDSTEWPGYFTIDKQIIAPYYEITNHKKMSKFKIGYKINECEYLWKKYIL